MRPTDCAPPTTAPSPASATGPAPAASSTPTAYPAAIEAFIRISDGAPWKEAGLPGIPARVAQDVRGYYELAALGLSDHAPPAWSGTRWFFDHTRTGDLVLRARAAMRDQGAKQPVWFYMAPGDR